MCVCSVASRSLTAHTARRKRQTQPCRPSRPPARTTTNPGREPTAQCLYSERIAAVCRSKQTLSALVERTHDRVEENDRVEKIHGRQCCSSRKHTHTRFQIPGEKTIGRQCGSSRKNATPLLTCACTTARAPSWMSEASSPFDTDSLTPPGASNACCNSSFSLQQLRPLLSPRLGAWSLPCPCPSALAAAPAESRLSGS